MARSIVVFFYIYLWNTTSEGRIGVFTTEKKLKQTLQFELKDVLEMFPRSEFSLAKEQNALNIQTTLPTANWKLETKVFSERCEEHSFLTKILSRTTGSSKPSNIKRPKKW